MNMKTNYPDIFSEFLKERGFYKEFISRLNTENLTDLPAFLEKNLPEDYVRMAFTWYPEYTRWREIHERWLEYLQKTVETERILKDRPVVKKDFIFLFAMFLQENQAYDSFIRNCEHACTPPIYWVISLRKQKPSDYLCKAFPWDKAPEKEGFWKELDEKWKNQLLKDYEEVLF